MANSPLHTCAISPHPQTQEWPTEADTWCPMQGVCCVIKSKHTHWEWWLPSVHSSALDDPLLWNCLHFVSLGFGFYLPALVAVWFGVNCCCMGQIVYGWSSPALTFRSLIFFPNLSSQFNFHVHESCQGGAWFSMSLLLLYAFAYVTCFLCWLLCQEGFCVELLCRLFAHVHTALACKPTAPDIHTHGMIGRLLHRRCVHSSVWGMLDSVVFIMAAEQCNVSEASITSCSRLVWIHKAQLVFQVLCRAVSINNLDRQAKLQNNGACFLVSFEQE